MKHPFSNRFLGIHRHEGLRRLFIREFWRLVGHDLVHVVIFRECNNCLASGNHFPWSADGNVYLSPGIHRYANVREPSLHQLRPDIRNDIIEIEIWKWDTSRINHVMEAGRTLLLLIPFSRNLLKRLFIWKTLALMSGECEFGVRSNIHRNISKYMATLKSKWRESVSPDVSSSTKHYRRKFLEHRFFCSIECSRVCIRDFTCKEIHRLP